MQLTPSCCSHQTRQLDSIPLINTTRSRFFSPLFAPQFFSIQSTNNLSHVDFAEPRLHRFRRFPQIFQFFDLFCRDPEKPFYLFLAFRFLAIFISYIISPISLNPVSFLIPSVRLLHLLLCCSLGFSQLSFIF